MVARGWGGGGWGKGYFGTLGWHVHTAVLKMDYQ